MEVIQLKGSREQYPTDCSQVEVGLGIRQGIWRWAGHNAMLSAMDPHTAIPRTLWLGGKRL